MADVSKVKINNTLYDVKDATARTDLATKAPLASPSLTGTPTAPTASSGTNTTQIATTEFAKGEADKKVSKSGDTMTGNLVISKNFEADFYTRRNDVIAGTAPSSDEWTGSYCFQEGTPLTLGYLGHRYTTGKTSVMRLVSQNIVNNLTESNYFDLLVANDGTRTVYISHPEAWRNGLGLGDSGWLTLTDSNVFNGTIYYRKIGFYVTVCCDDVTLKTSMDDASWRGLATIPAGYRCTKDLTQPILTYGVADQNGYVWINKNGGSINIRAKTGMTIGTTAKINFLFTYPVD